MLRLSENPSTGACPGENRKPITAHNRLQPVLLDTYFLAFTPLQPLGCFILPARSISGRHIILFPGAA